MSYLKIPTNMRMPGDVAWDIDPTKTVLHTEYFGYDSTGLTKFWNNAAWAKKEVKVWDGSKWVRKPVKVWNGAAWVKTN